MRCLQGTLLFAKPFFRVVKNCFAVYSRFAVLSRFGAVVSVCVQTVFFDNKQEMPLCPCPLLQSFSAQNNFPLNVVGVFAQ